MNIKYTLQPTSHTHHCEHQMPHAKPINCGLNSSGEPHRAKLLACCLKEVEGTHCKGKLGILCLRQSFPIFCVIHDLLYMVYIATHTSCPQECMAQFNRLNETPPKKKPAGKVLEDYLAGSSIISPDLSKVAQLAAGMKKRDGSAEPDGPAVQLATKGTMKRKQQVFISTL